MTAKDPNAHPNLTLSGDFSSPTEVLAADELSREDKRQILETWLGEISRAQPNVSDELEHSVRTALDELDPK